ncbi:MAG TPA: HAD family hydrolase [Dissulfurispiraceae bacterium]
MKLILFDIDGTLIDSGGAGTRSLDYAFRELFALDNAFRGISMAGKTDPQIISECLAKHGFKVDNNTVDGVIASYLKHLRIEIRNNGRHVKPGIVEVLNALGGMGARCSLGLLTGNIEQGARIKLESFDLNGYFPSGAFGSDDEDRNKLLPFALRRFEDLCGMKIDPRDCVVVGDTPRDVYCAKPYGAACIGVATGPYRADSLVSAGADAVFNDLSDTAAFLTAALSPL